MVMSCNLNFDSLASAIKMFSLNRKNIAQRIAYEFINNPMFFETLSDIIDKMLDSDVEQKKKTTQAKVEEPVLETEEVHEVIEEKPVEETQHTEAETDDSLQEKKNSVDEYLKSHGLI